MKEQFAPYEQALKFKELGFDEECFGEYRQWDGNTPFLKLYKDVDECSTDAVDYEYTTECLAPLWQQAFDWFRKEKGFDSWIVPIHYIEKEKLFKEYSYIIEPVIFDETFSIDDTDSETYEEARLECLKKLIELCKNVK